MKSADVKLTSNDGTEDIKVIAGKKIEPAITAVVMFYCSGDFVQVPDSTAWIINRRDEIKVSAIGISHHFKQDWQTVDRFLQWGNFHLPRAVTMFCSPAANRKMAKGKWGYEGMIGYTSRGVGTSRIKVRYFCPPEITVITLRN